MRMIAVATPLLEAEVGSGHLDRLEKGKEVIFPDPTSQSVAEGRRNGVSKALEHEFGAFVPTAAAKAA